MARLRMAQKLRGDKSCKEYFCQKSKGKKKGQNSLEEWEAAGEAHEQIPIEFHV